MLFTNIKIKGFGLWPWPTVYCVGNLHNHMTRIYSTLNFYSCLLQWWTFLFYFSNESLYPNDYIFCREMLKSACPIIQVQIPIVYQSWQRHSSLLQAKVLSAPPMQPMGKRTTKHVQLHAESAEIVPGTGRPRNMFKSNKSPPPPTGGV